MLCNSENYQKMETKTKAFHALPIGAVIIGAKGRRKDGKSISIVKYRVNNEIFTAWIPIEGGAA